MKVHVNPSPALSVVLTCIATDALPDMSLVTASRILVRHNSGAEVVWETTVDAVSPTRRVVRHRYVSGEDFVDVGAYTLRVEHDTPTGTVASKNVLTIEVVPKWTTIP